MHNLQPPLLHRDLKIENILQATQNTFKLCDFGSATACATRLPSTAAEIRVLEADLNRHTTLQYRAPEMVDLYLRRPIDEKAGTSNITLEKYFMVTQVIVCRRLGARSHVVQIMLLHDPF
jgi:serine/threonine protein kinase